MNAEKTPAESFLDTLAVLEKVRDRHGGKITIPCQGLEVDAEVDRLVREKAEVDRLEHNRSVRLRPES